MSDPLHPDDFGAVLEAGVDLAAISLAAYAIIKALHPSLPELSDFSFR